MVDLSTLSRLLLLASLIVVLVAVRAVCAIVVVRGGGSILARIGVSRIVQVGRHCRMSRGPSEPRRVVTARGKKVKVYHKMRRASKLGHIPPKRLCPTHRLPPSFRTKSAHTLKLCPAINPIRSQYVRRVRCVYKLRRMPYLE